LLLPPAGVDIPTYEHDRLLVVLHAIFK